MAGAVSIAAFTGAERASTAYERFRVHTNEPEVIMFGGGNCPFSKNLDLKPMASLPPVESMQAGWNTFVNVYDQQGHLLIYSDPNFDGTLNAFDLDEPDSVRPLLLSGRYPRTADEVLMGWGECQKCGAPWTERRSTCRSRGPTRSGRSPVAMSRRRTTCSPFP